MLILATVLTILIPNCETTPRVEYIHDIPDVVFPVFPPPEPVMLDVETETVSMPLWYWEKVAAYKIDVDAIEEYISRLRKESGEEHE
jgi:hypothetical protein